MAQIWGLRDEIFFREFLISLVNISSYVLSPSWRLLKIGSGVYIKNNTFLLKIYIKTPRICCLSLWNRKCSRHISISNTVLLYYLWHRNKFSEPGNTIHFLKYWTCRTYIFSLPTYADFLSPVSAEQKKTYRGSINSRITYSYDCNRTNTNDDRLLDGCQPEPLRSRVFKLALISSRRP